MDGPRRGVAGAVRALDPGGGWESGADWTAEDQIHIVYPYRYTAQSAGPRAPQPGHITTQMAQCRLTPLGLPIV